MKSWKQKLGAVVGATALVVSGAGIAGADSLSGDGDLLHSSDHQRIDSATECAALPATYNARAILNYGGSKHYNSGATITMTPSASTAAGAAGIQVSGPEQKSHSAWDANNDSLEFDFTFRVPAGIADGDYAIDVKTNGAGTNTSGTDSPIANYEVTSSFDIKVTCAQFATGGGSTNSPPTVDAGGPYEGAEGSAVSITGSVSDAEDTPTTAWTYVADPVAANVDAGATCSFGSATAKATTVTCTDDGTYVLTLSANDGTNLPVTDTATLTIGNADPSVGTVTVTPTGACAISVSTSFTDAGSNDTHRSSIDWGDSSASDDADPDTTPVSGSHTYTSAGEKTITITVTDDDAGDDSDSGSFTTKNTPSAFLAPINTGAGVPRSVFKGGSTIPVKLTVTDCGRNLVSSLTPTVQLQKVDSTSDGSVNELQITEAATNGKAMKWDGSQYHYNLSTKKSQFCSTAGISGCTGGDLTAGSYQLAVTDATFFAPSKALFDLK